MSEATSEADERYMAEALRLAERGRYSTHPNPRVGALVVKQGVIIGRGWHRAAGEAHAEVLALREAGAAAAGATVYVTLEPCSHHGRTPPCAEALIAAGVERVVAATVDPNPLVSGRGLAALAATGIQTRVNVLASAAEDLNAGFFSRMRRGRPWLCLKLAASLDGRTALANGVSRWITGPAAREDVQRLRAESDVILTGIGTVLADDPALTVRDSPYRDAIVRQPLRVVVDAQGRLPASATLACDGGRSLQVTAVRDPGSELVGVERLHCPGSDGRVDLFALLTHLAERGSNQVLVEAGPGLAGGLMALGLVDELVLYLAPLLLGSGARALFDWPDLTQLDQAPQLQLHDCRRIGPDLRLRYRPG